MRCAQLAAMQSPPLPRCRLPPPARLPACACQVCGASLLLSALSYPASRFWYTHNWRKINQNELFEQKMLRCVGAMRNARIEEPACSPHVAVACSWRRCVHVSSPAMRLCLLDVSLHSLQRHVKQAETHGWHSRMPFCCAV